MSRIFVFFLAMAVAAGMGDGAPAGGENETPGPDAGKPAEFSDPARPITAAPGGKFVITLESNRTTGFCWQVAKPLDEKVVKLSGSEYVPSQSDLDGAPGKELWTFTAVEPGQTAISLKYIRPWEKNKPPAKEVNFTVIVRSEMEP
jgi:inhibitor of cysteine peptidase